MHTRRTLFLAGTLLLVASVALAHDLFLKLDTYFLAPRTRVRISVLNGTFTKSEGVVAPERVADISVVSPAGRTRLPAATAWSRGPDSASVLSLAVGDAGTYVAGASTRTWMAPMEISTVSSRGEAGEGRSARSSRPLKIVSRPACYWQEASLHGGNGALKRIISIM